LEAIVATRVVALKRLCTRSRGKLNDALKRPCLSRNAHQEVARQVGLYLARANVDKRRSVRDLDGLGHRAHLQSDIERRKVADQEFDCVLGRAEARGGRDDGVGSRREVGEPVITARVRLGCLSADQGRARDLNCSFGDYGTAWIFHYTLQTGGGLLSDGGA